MLLDLDDTPSHRYAESAVFAPPLREWAWIDRDVDPREELTPCQAYPSLGRLGPPG